MLNRAHLVVLVIGCTMVNVCRTSLPATISIGGIFETGASTEKAAFEFAIEEVNRDTSILGGITLIPMTENVEDAFTTSKKACKILRTEDKLTNKTSGVGALFTVLDQSSTELVSSLCEQFTIPMIQVTPDLSSKPNTAADFLSRMKINVHPNVEVLSQAFLDFVQRFQWTKVLVLYQGNEGLIRLKSVLNSGYHQLTTGGKKIDAVFWEINGIEKTLKELRYNVQYKRIIVDIQTDQITYFLDVAARMGILTSYHHYMFTSLDLAAINIGKFSMGGVNITGYRMIDTRSSIAQRLLHQWVLSSVRPREEASAMLLRRCTDIRSRLFSLCPCAARMVTCYRNNTIAYIPQTLTDRVVGLCPDCLRMLLSRNALVIDGVQMFARALNYYLDGLDDFSTKSINCQSRNVDQPWPSGESIYNQFSSVAYQGLTGKLEIDKGERKNVKLDLIEYNTDGNIQVIGEWSQGVGLNVTKSSEMRMEEIQKDLNNKTLRIVVKEEHPLVIVRHTDEDGNAIPDGANEKFVGYAIDMMTEIGKYLNVSYTYQLVPDGSTGLPLSNGSWTGMIGMLMSNQADLAVGDVTINYERSSVIDFTKPFMNLGISILFKKPDEDPPKLFSFLEPLDNNIWMCMIGAYACVSLFLFIVARFSPYEWKNPHPCNLESDTVENDFTLLNSFWFNIGSLMQQGCELAPKASSTRIIAGVWWFFTLILISSYTANLAAFLTITRMTTPIKNADDLAKQTEIKYGCQFGGSTYRFFKNSKIPTYEKMWNFMSQHPDVFVNKSDLGIAKVKAGNYAYLMESIPLRYQLSQHCDLMEVGGELDSKGFGIGVPKNSPYRDALSNAILSLSEQQILLDLYNKWWNVDSPKCLTPDDSKSPSSASKLGLKNLGGIFVFLIGGLGLALIIAVIEFIINAMVNSKTDKQTLCSEIREECMFALKCCGPSEKPAKLSSVNGNSHLEDTGDDLEASTPLKSSRINSSFN